MLKVLALLSISSSAYAAGGGGSITDLAIPALNFGILFIFLFIKLRKPISEGFTKQSEEVASLYKSAEEKDKEAQLKLDEFEKKMASLTAEKEKIIANAKADGERFDASHTEETNGMIARYKTDTQAKLDHEKTSMLRDINSSLLDEVIAKTKAAVKTNKDSQSKITGKLVAEIK